MPINLITCCCSCCYCLWKNRFRSEILRYPKNNIWSEIQQGNCFWQSMPHRLPWVIYTVVPRGRGKQSIRKWRGRENSGSWSSACQSDNSETKNRNNHCQRKLVSCFVCATLRIQILFLVKYWMLNHENIPFPWTIFFLAKRRLACFFLSVSMVLFLRTLSEFFEGQIILCDKEISGNGAP